MKNVYFIVLNQETKDEEFCENRKDADEKFKAIHSGFLLKWYEKSNSELILKSKNIE